MTAIQELTRLDQAVDRGAARLLELQHPGGWWVGELESNATMIAEHLFWLHVLGLRDPDTDRRLANDILARRRDDGTWSNWWEGPADLSTTIESYVALKMAGVDPGAATLDYIRRQGGIPRSRVFTKCFMALLGHWPWQRIVPIPPEMILLPPSAPFSIYNFACWARQTVVPLSVVWALRPVRHADVDLRSIGARPGETKAPSRPSSSPPPRPRGRGGMGEGAPGGGRLMGRDPAALGLVDRHARRARSRLRGRDAPPRGRGLGVVPRRGRRPVATRGVPVAGLGHRPRGARAARGGSGRRPSAAAQGRRVAAGGGGPGQGATGRSAVPSSSPAGGRSSSRTTSIPMWTTPPSSRWLFASSVWATPPSGGVSTGSWGCSRRTAAGARSTPTTRATGSTSCRSATSAT